MKVCKNHFDIIVYSLSNCEGCAFEVTTKRCCWVDIIKNYSFNCGGVAAQSLSDIFKL